jgi:TonB family protein
MVSEPTPISGKRDHVLAAEPVQCLLVCMPTAEVVVDPDHVLPADNRNNNDKKLEWTLRRDKGDQALSTRVAFLVTTVAWLIIGAAEGAAQPHAVAVGAVQTSEAPAKAPPGSRENPMRVSSGVMAGLILQKVDPVYPEDTKNVSGVVVLAATIDDEGKVMSVSVVSGPEKLRDAALTAVRQWTYKPYLLNGKPVFVQTVVSVIFPRRQ